MSHDDSREQPLQHEAEHAKPGKKNAVLLYLVILFAAAFLLLLLSYFMQQRTNQERYDDLQQTSNSAVQTLDNMLQENEDLKNQVSELEAANEALHGQLQDSRVELAEEQESSQQALTAMDWFWRIQRQYSRGYHTKARELIAAFEATGLPQYLPTENRTGQEGPSPLQQYRDILDLLDVETTSAPAPSPSAQP
ncbi:MAG: hypothetical protein KH704_03320 [Clostridiales bacterium]|nr:hypothetical protein [Clostridiales bacterium]